MIPADNELAKLDYDALVALAATDPTLDVGASIARQLELVDARTAPTVANLRAAARDRIQGVRTVDPARPISAHRIAAAAAAAPALARSRARQQSINARGFAD